MCQVATVKGGAGSGQCAGRGEAWGATASPTHQRWEGRAGDPGRGRAALAYRSEKPTEELRHPKIPFSSFLCRELPLPA